MNIKGFASGAILFIIGIICLGQTPGPQPIPAGPPTGAAGGDLAGNYPNPGVAKIAGVAPATGMAAAIGNVFGTTSTTFTVGNDARLGAGAVTGAVKSNGSNTFTQAACADLSNAATSCSTDATNASNIVSGTVANARLTGSGATTVAGQGCTLGSTCGLTTATNSVSGGNIALNNTANFFDGPSMAQGTTGTWYTDGTVAVAGDTNDNIVCKLWDGTTVKNAAAVTIANSAQLIIIHLSGIFVSPAANIRISCRDVTGTNGSMPFNNSGTGTDLTISGFRAD